MRVTHLSKCVLKGVCISTLSINVHCVVVGAQSNTCLVTIPSMGCDTCCQALQLDSRHDSIPKGAKVIGGVWEKPPPAQGAFGPDSFWGERKILGGYSGEGNF